MEVKTKRRCFLEIRMRIHSGSQEVFGKKAFSSRRQSGHRFVSDYSISQAQGQFFKQDFT
jgi:hypothetical protein